MMTTRLLAAVLCGVLALGVAPATAAAPSAASMAGAIGAEMSRQADVVKGKDRPWKGAGFKIRRQAPGWAWMGARRLGGQIVYRADPFKSAKARKHQQPQGVSAMGGSAAATARAAWVISKYGRLQQPHQGAAVEVALHAILSPKKHGLDDKATKKRLRRIGKDRRTVKKYVRVMLSDSIRYAGPYQLSVDAGKPVSDGGSAVVTATLVSAAGVGMPGVPLTFIHPDGTSTPAETSGAGTATVTMRATGQGAPTATATELPDVQLNVMSPAGKKKQRKKAPRLLVAGEKSGVLSEPIGIGRKAKPELTINAPTTALNVFDTYGFIANYTGSTPTSAGRSSRVDVLGPFPTQSAADCDPDAPVRYGPFVRSYSADEQGAIGTVKFSVGGWYRVKGSVDGDEQNETAVATCSPPFLVAKAPVTLGVTGAPRSYQFDGSIWMEWAFRYGGPVSSDGAASNPVLTARLHGPFQTGNGATSCSAESAYPTKPVTLQVVQSGELLRVQMRIPEPGVWRASLTAPEGDFTQAATTCGISGSTG